jgi:hypothetical protein
MTQITTWPGTDCVTAQSPHRVQRVPAPGLCLASGDSAATLANTLTDGLALVGSACCCLPSRPSTPVVDRP